MNWQNISAVKKGKIGEDVVRRWLTQRGFVVYNPDPDAGAHPFDHLCASKDKRSIFIAESKAKPKRKYYPDTGINLSSYKDYKEIQARYSIDVFLFFVDEDEEMIYGGKLSELEIPRQVSYRLRIIEYPLIQNGIIYFPRACMVDIAPLDKRTALDLFELSTRKQDYLE